MSIPDDEWNDFQSRWKEYTFKKGEHLVKQGEIEKCLYIVNEGVQRLYVLTPDGQDVTLAFSFDHSFSGDYWSMINQKPSMYNMEAIADSKLWGIGYSDMTQIYDRYPTFDRWGRKLMEMVVIMRGKREIELITCSAEERFENFVARSPHCLQIIPQKYLASYLNMTPETFSRIRAKRT